MKLENKKSYKICSKTVMDISDPEISFDKEGISNYYWDFQNKIKPNWPYLNQGEERLNQLINKIKSDGINKDFDCILGLSGGMDSSYMLHLAVKEYGLRPLVFHVDGGWNSDSAVSNINNLVDSLGVDLYTEVINWIEMRDFQLSMFKAGVPHLDIPQDMAFISVLYRFAEKYKIKHILNGGNVATESLSAPVKILYWCTDMSQIRDILSKFGSVEMRTYPFTSIYYHKIYLRYLKKIKVHKILNYVDYDKKKAENLLKKNYSWKPFPQKHFESRFTKFFEGYWLPKRFGWDMRRRQFSSLILSNQMTRENALKELEKSSYNEETIKQDFKYIAKKLGITTEELNNFLRSEKKFYYNYKNQKWIFDFGEKILSTISGTRRGGAT